MTRTREELQRDAERAKAHADHEVAVARQRMDLAEGNILAADERRFPFPPLGPTGEGEPMVPPDGNRENRVYWQHPVYGAYAVTYQWDRPAVAFRCHYPGGSSPCDEATAKRFIAWAKAKLDERREGT